MINLFKESDEATTSDTSTSADTEIDGGIDPLANWRVVDGKIHRDDEPESYASSRSNDNEPPPQDRKSRVAEVVVGAYTAEKFQRHLAKALARVGQKKGLNSLMALEANADFGAVSEILHRRVIVNLLGSLLGKLSDEAVEDIIVVSVCSGPLLRSVMAEIAAKKKAQREAENLAKAANDNEPENTTNE